VFEDPNVVIEQDREVDEEPRWQAIGIVNGTHMLLVAYVDFDLEEAIHIISARKATPHERRNMQRTVKDGMVTYYYTPGEPLTETQKRDLENLANMKDEDIDTSDIPELTEKFWKNAVRGNPFFRPIKKAVSLRLDADVIAWLKKDGAGYQTRANNILRERMLRDNS